MNKEFIKKINDISEIILEDKRFSMLNNLEEFWVQLNKLFEEWESKIEEEHKKKFIRDYVENDFKQFAERCMEYIIESKEILNSSRDRIIQFFENHRHAGYGFYVSYDALNSIDQDVKNQGDIELINSYEKILKDSEYKKIIYCSLADYFLQFYGSFNDNEMAITMLCKYYSDDMDLDEKMQELLVSALYTHVTNAGTPNDIGFAFGGISRIIDGIGKLSTIIIEKLLKKYEIYRVINDKVYRRQVYTIIKYSKINPVEKNKYKFFFIDSIWIANLLSTVIYSKNKNPNGNNEIDRIDWYSKAYVDLELPVFQKKDGTHKCFWTYEDYGCRSLKLENETIAKISFNEDIFIQFSNKSKKIDFIPDDWILNNYDTSKFENELEEFVGLITPYNDYSYKHKFLFSYIYVNGYRGVEHRYLSFDHKYSFNAENNSIIINDTNSSHLESFYGRNIYSLSCIVGKNGTGKTSILGFLRKFIFVIINLMEENRLKLDNGIVKIDQDIIIEDTVLKKETTFLVVFKFNNKYYVLTNMKNIKYDKSQILPYQSGLLAKKNDNSKIIYFSNMIDINDDRLFDTAKSRMITNEDDLIQENVLKSLQGLRNVDYSENLSFIKKQHSIIQAKKQGKIANKDVNVQNLNNDLIYQIIFLDAHNDEKLIEWFGKNFTKNNLLNNYPENNEFKRLLKIYLEGSLKEILSDEKQGNLFQGLAYSLQTQIKPLSSGQYAKFSFLSKLYWCLKGYDDYQEVLQKVFGANKFYIQDTIQENDTAIIFIDEGELYYHPEWQRTYISTLTNMINSLNKNIQIQVVMTTNSPFIISDIRRNDIMFITKDNKKPVSLTFGQNIHTLLTSNLFMDYTIGELARKRIEFIIKQIKKQDDSKYKSKTEIVANIKEEINISVSEQSVYKFLKDMIELIGEDIYRVKLLNMLDDCMSNSQSELEKLEQEMLEIEEKIKKLKNK